MYYYNPYYSYLLPKQGLFSKIVGGINFGSILSGTQKTLNIINQAIPVIKEVKPIVNNAKTMFSVMNEFRKVDEKPVKKIDNDGMPTFFK